MGYQISGALPGSKRLAVIACEVLFREVCSLSAVSHNIIDHYWLSQGLHDLGQAEMSRRIQESIDAIPERGHDAILLGFGLCNNGIVGLRASHTPLVIPRGHDCITFFLGSRSTYCKHFEENPGTFYLTSGWLERDENTLEGETVQSIPDTLGLGLSAKELTEKYGPENAAYLAETLGDLTRHYSKIAYIEPEFLAEMGFEEEARNVAAQKGWEFERIHADLGLLSKWLEGHWDDDFLVVPPGECVAASYGDDIVRSCSAHP